MVFSKNFSPKIISSKSYFIQYQLIQSRMSTLESRKSLGIQPNIRVSNTWKGWNWYRLWSKSWDTRHGLIVNDESSPSIFWYQIDVKANTANIPFSAENVSKWARYSPSFHRRYFWSFSVPIGETPRFFIVIFCWGIVYLPNWIFKKIILHVNKISAFCNVSKIHTAIWASNFSTSDHSGPEVLVHTKGWLWKWENYD